MILEIDDLHAYYGDSHVLQGVDFPELSVKDNLFLGTLIRRRRNSSISEAVFDHLPALRERLGQEGGSLSGGEQHMSKGKITYAGPTAELRGNDRVLQDHLVM